MPARTSRSFGGSLARPVPPAPVLSPVAWLCSCFCRQRGHPALPADGRDEREDGILQLPSSPSRLGTNRGLRISGSLNELTLLRLRLEPVVVRCQGAAEGAG